MTAPLLTFQRGELDTVMALLGAEVAGHIVPVPGERRQRYSFTLRMFDRRHNGLPSNSLRAAKIGLVALLNEKLWSAGLLEPGRQVEVDDRTEGLA